MILISRQVWELARPYRARLFLGVITGILAGLMAPLLMATIWVVSTLVFQPGIARSVPSAAYRRSFNRGWTARAPA